MTPKCPLRFKEHTSNEADQRCQEDCAWLMVVSDKPSAKACALAIIAYNIGNSRCIENESEGA